MRREDYDNEEERVQHPRGCLEALCDSAGGTENEVGYDADDDHDDEEKKAGADKNMNLFKYQMSNWGCGPRSLCTQWSTVGVRAVVGTFQKTRSFSAVFDGLPPPNRWQQRENQPNSGDCTEILPAHNAGPYQVADSPPKNAIST